MLAKKVVRRNKVRRRIRKQINGTHTVPRLSIFRSNKEIYAQIINDLNGHTLASASSKDIKADDKSTKTEVSKEVGRLVAERAKAAGIEKVVFDRGGYLYHGRVKSLAEGAREGGLNL